MAKRAPDPDDVTLYDLDPKFQERLLKWLLKTGSVVEIFPTTSGFNFVLDSGESLESPDFETGICELMGARYKRSLVDPEFSERVHASLTIHGARLVFSAGQPLPEEVPYFSVQVASNDARGGDSDEDFEVALVLAEDKFLQQLPKHRLSSQERLALEEALVPPAEREEVAEEQHERLRRSLMEPREDMEPNHRQLMPYARWRYDVDEKMRAGGMSLADASPEYWSMLYQAGFDPSHAVREFGMANPAGHWLVPNGDRPPPPPRRKHADTLRHVRRMVREHDKPFDPEAPREHYARSHHFAVNPGETFQVLKYYDNEPTLDSEYGDLLAALDRVKFIESMRLRPDRVTIRKVRSGQEVTLGYR